MGSKNKAKGTYHENAVLKWFKSLGLKARRQPLSGALGGDFAGDIELYAFGRRLVVEVKYRTATSFPSPFKLLEREENNLLIYKRKTGSPKQLVIMTSETFEELINAKSSSVISSQVGENSNPD